jgi:hypothetical protein
MLDKEPNEGKDGQPQEAEDVEVQLKLMWCRQQVLTMLKMSMVSVVSSGKCFLTL